MNCVFGATLDGLRKFFGRNLAKREIDPRQVLSIECVKFGIVGGAVLGTKPPAPVAALGGQERFMRLFESRVGWRVASGLFSCLHSSGVDIARIPK